jgi:outer membrane receptor protein involved in Fe transport
MRVLSVFLAIIFSFLIAPETYGQLDRWEGRRLAEYLEFLNDQGHRVIFSNDLVVDEYLLASEPATDDPLENLDSILEPFGLEARRGPAGSVLVARAASESAAIDRKPAAAVPEPLPIPEIIVTSSLHRLEYGQSATNTYFDRELATRIPVTADEAVRLTHRLPGTASSGISSQSHIRGGEVNEVLFLFDGLRLYEPYHLKDFQSIATIINSNAIGGIDVYSGAFPARYGDRMSGVMSIDLREPTRQRETELALSFFNTSLLSLGTFGEEEQGDWLVAARRGNLDLIVDVVDPEFGSPDYQDFLAHTSWEFGRLAKLSANILYSNDKLSLVDNARGEAATAAYTNEVAWLKWEADWTSSLDSRTIFAFSDIADRRQGTLLLPGIVSGVLSDEARIRALEIRQDWNWVASDTWMLRFGFNLKDLDANYRFSSSKTLVPPFDTILDNQPVTETSYELSPGGAQYAAYTEFRWRPGPHWTMDLGVRWDQQNYTTSADDKQYSPRVSFLYQPTERTDIRLGWGQYHQAQEINELQVSDGVDEFYPAQRAEHVVLSVEHLLGSGIELAVSVYRKSFRRIRPRFENVFNSLTLLPELQFDRVRVDATSAEARGAELMLLRGSADDDLFWWFGYAWSEVNDRTEHADIRRSWDQTHTFKTGLSWRWRAWDLSIAGEVHTGWPKTLMTGTSIADDPGLVLETSERNAYRYSVFHTLDVRLSRTIDLARGDLTAFLEITNLYNRANPCCTEYSLNEDGSLASREAHWLPLVPSLGIVWGF